MMNSKNVPKIRFKGFNGEWVEKKLGDKTVTSSYSGGTPSVGVNEYYNGSIPFIRSGEINSSSTELFITDKGLENSSAKLVDIGDILYALYGATSGEVGISKLNGAINQAIMAIKPQNNYNTRFISYWLRKEKNNIINTYLQGGQGNLSSAIVKELIIDFPTYAEQTQIGNYFQNIDTLITTSQNKLNKLKKIKKACLEKMFPRKGATIPEIRFKGFNGEWEEKKLGEISPSIFDGTHQTPQYTESGIPFFSVENIVSGNKNKYISEKDYKISISKNKPELGDILITRIGTIGFSKIVDWNYEFSIYVTLAVIKKSYNFIPYYLHFYFQTKRYQNEILNKSLLSAVPCKINMNELRTTYILLPPNCNNKEEQIQIGNYFQTLDNLITKQEQQLTKLKNIKKGCLEKMFVNTTDAL